MSYPLLLETHVRFTAYQEHLVERQADGGKARSAGDLRLIAVVFRNWKLSVSAI